VEDVPYYIYDDDEEKSHVMSPDGEAYIDDGDLKELLIDMLGDDVPEEEIQKILKAASDENLSEEDFDKLVDDFILNHKS
jgi:Ca2+-binding EF-hand superfamily protein